MSNYKNLSRIILSVFSFTGVVFFASNAMAADPIDVKVPRKCSTGLELVVKDVTLAAGESLEWHKNLGIEIVYVASGGVELYGEASPIRYLPAAQSAEFERNIAHKIVNAGDQPAVLVLTLLKDRGSADFIPIKRP